MGVVPLGLVVALLELETKVLPALDLADLGEGHPQALFGCAAAEVVGEDVVESLKRAPEAPLGSEVEGGQPEVGSGLLGGETEIIGEVQLAGSRVADAEERGPVHIQGESLPALLVREGGKGVARQPPVGAGGELAGVHVLATCLARHFGSRILKPPPAGALKGESVVERHGPVLAGRVCETALDEAGTGSVERSTGQPQPKRFALLEIDDVALSGDIPNLEPRGQLARQFHGHPIEDRRSLRRGELLEHRLAEPHLAGVPAHQQMHRNAPYRLLRQHPHLTPLPVVGAHRERRSLPPQWRTVHVHEVEVEGVVGAWRAADALGFAPRGCDNGRGAHLVQLNRLRGAPLYLGVLAVVAREQVALTLEPFLPRSPAIRLQQVALLSACADRLLDHSSSALRLGAEQARRCNDTVAERAESGLGHRVHTPLPAPHSELTAKPLPPVRVAIGQSGPGYNSRHAETHHAHPRAGV